jgi:hypothetical protein
VSEKITPEMIKAEIDDVITDCKKRIIEGMKNLDMKHSGADWLFAQRVCNHLWCWSNPHAAELVLSKMKEGSECE